MTYGKGKTTRKKNKIKKQLEKLGLKAPESGERIGPLAKKKLISYIRDKKKNLRNKSKKKNPNMMDIDETNKKKGKKKPGKSGKFTGGFHKYTEDDILNYGQHQSDNYKKKQRRTRSIKNMEDKSPAQWNAITRNTDQLNQHIHRLKKILKYHGCLAKTNVEYVWLWEQRKRYDQGLLPDRWLQELDDLEDTDNFNWMDVTHKNGNPPKGARKRYQKQFVKPKKSKKKKPEMKKIEEQKTKIKESKKSKNKKGNQNEAKSSQMEIDTGRTEKKKSKVKKSKAKCYDMEIDTGGMMI